MTASNVRDRYIGPCFTQGSEGHPDQVDITTFLIRLLLFDQYIIQSNRLIEFNKLVDAFVYQGLRDLLSSGAIKVHCEAYLVGQTGQTGLGFRGRKRDGTPKALLPLNSYSFDIITLADQKKAMHENLTKIHSIPQLKHKEAIRLKGLIAESLVWFPKESTRNILLQLLHDLRSQTPTVRKAVLLKLQQKFKDEAIPENDIEIAVEVDDEDDVHAHSNLSGRFRLNHESTHEIIGMALLAVGGLNTRIETMRAFSALSGFRYGELSVFEDKLSFVTAAVDPSVQEQRTRRILAWSELPDLEEAISNKRIRIDRLMELRESKECADFRRWLWSANDLADNELHERIGSLFSKVSLSLSSKTGRVLRWLATTGIGLVPGVGQALGPAAGVLDTFVLDKLLQSDGVVTFLGQAYPSIFEDT